MSSAAPKDLSNTKTVIFLGAGASAAEGAPIQSALFRNYFESIKLSGPYASSHTMQRELATFFFLMFGIDVDHDDLVNTNFPTFEEALGILDLAEIRRESFKDFDLENLAVNSGRIRFIRQYLILAMAKIIADDLVNSTGEKLHRKLVKRLARQSLLPNTRFISMNYDLLIDNALSANGMGGQEMVDYGIDLARYEEQVQAERIVGATPLFKLHGSLNWLHCPSCNNLSITPGEKAVAHFANEVQLCERCKTVMTFVIVPPTYYKDMFKVFINVVWNKAETILREADQIIFCGYSFPDADMHVKYLLKRVEVNRQANKPLRFVVINNHSGKREEQAKEEKDRYERFFLSRVNYTNASFEDFVKEPQQFYQR